MGAERRALPRGGLPHGPGPAAPPPFGLCGSRREPRRYFLHLPPAVTGAAPGLPELRKVALLPLPAAGGPRAANYNCAANFQPQARRRPAPTPPPRARPAPLRARRAPAACPSRSPQGLSPSAPAPPPPSPRGRYAPSRRLPQPLGPPPGPALLCPASHLAAERPSPFRRRLPAVPSRACRPGSLRRGWDSDREEAPPPPGPGSLRSALPSARGTHSGGGGEGCEWGGGGGTPRARRPPAGRLPIGQRPSQPAQQPFSHWPASPGGLGSGWPRGAAQ